MNWWPILPTRSAFRTMSALKKMGAFITSSFKRTIGGKSFLFVSDMYGGMLAGYRFDEQTCGYIAIPFLFAHNGDPDQNRDITFWVDQNGDAVRQENEYAEQPPKLTNTR